MAHRLFEGKEHAASYLKYRISPSTELIGQIINFVEKQKSRPLELALDVGCGSGQGTVLLSKHCNSLVGIDVSPSQLQMALQYSREPNITYKECVAEELPFADSSLDLVTSMSAFHWFDRQRFLQEADRVLKPLGCLALLSYTLDMEISYQDCCTETLNQVCKEFYAALRPYRNSYLGERSVDLYRAAYESLPYPEKEWQESFWVRRPMPLSGYMGFAESFSSYQALLREDPVRAKSLSQDICQRLMSIMKVESPETEVLVSVEYFYLLARKPQQDYEDMAVPAVTLLLVALISTNAHAEIILRAGEYHTFIQNYKSNCVIVKQPVRPMVSTTCGARIQDAFTAWRTSLSTSKPEWALQYRNPDSENLGLALIDDEAAAAQKLQLVKNNSSLRLKVNRSSYGIIFYCLQKSVQRCALLRQFYIHLPAELIHRSVGESLELSCSGCSGQQQHMWRMDNPGTAGQSHNNTLMFPSLTSNHSGLYVCKQGHVYLKHVYLYVCPEAEPPAAAFFTRGGNMTLQCGDWTQPGLAYWFMRSSRTVGRVSRVRNDQQHLMCLPDTTLVMTNVSVEDSGEFRCVIMRNRRCVFTSKMLVMIREPEVDHHLVRSALCLVVIIMMMSVTVAMIWRSRHTCETTSVQTEDVEGQTHQEQSAMANRLFEGKEQAATYWKYRLSPSELIEHAIKFLEKQKSRPFELAVDTGCGSGQATVVLAKHFASVIGTDVSPAQLDKAVQHSLMPNITYKECVAEKLPVADISVDLVTAVSAFHWFDGPCFLQEVDRVLKPGGCLAMFNFTGDMELSYPDCCLESLQQVCDEFHGALRPYWSPLLINNVQRYLEVYKSIPYTEKEWHEGVRVKRSVPLSSYIGLVESFSSYEALRREDPQRAASLSQDICQRLMSIMKVTSAETEVLLTVKYYYMLASKPQP
ncbi:uncharacterized protein LOC128766291 [Synchiropus splendidus]|uniref:uncharacterized protein LOC128766291 n=1 Tax=Synchiropus splendidus TaxID=270530 RepID=UPI00237D7919|nr:uncharacterized protein LOC128766291 [Synchiropus splendidus]